MCKVGITCGKPNFSPRIINHLRFLGGEIHAGRQPFVFDGGFVGSIAGQKGNVNYATQSSTGNRSASRQGQGRRAPRRPGPYGQTQPFRSRATEEAHGAGFRLLARHYEALAFEHEEGLWVTVKAKPLGSRGPQAHFLIFAPNDSNVRTSGWAFSAIGSRARLFPLKHTNFPDASICAFTEESGAWVPADGLLRLADHYSLWAVKSWHRSVFGWWPGDQVGACALYRRLEFDAAEWCGCGSGKRYSDCHLTADWMVPEDFARREFVSLFRLDYDQRRPPPGIVEAARTRWKKLPPLKQPAATR